jgi:hypothetical protein
MWHIAHQSNPSTTQKKKKKKTSPCMVVMVVVHACNPSTQEAEAGRWEGLQLRPPENSRMWKKPKFQNSQQQSSLVNILFCFNYGFKKGKNP